MTFSAFKFTLRVGIPLVAVWLSIFVLRNYQTNVSEKKRQLQKKMAFIEPSGPWKKLDLQARDISPEVRKLSENIVIKAKGQPVRFRHHRTPENANNHPNYNDGQMLFQFLNFKRVVKPEKAKSNLTFVFLHSAAFTSDVWVHLGTLSVLGSLGFNAIAYDLPTYGLTQEKLGHVTEHLFVSKVYYMTQLFEKMSNVILVAPSMSAKYALPFAVTKPERLAGLVLVGPVDTGLVPRKKLEFLQVPTLLMYGDRDKQLGLESRLVLQIIPNFRCQVLKNASHAAYIDQPDDFHTYLYNFALAIDDI